MEGDKADWGGVMSSDIIGRPSTCCSGFSEAAESLDGLRCISLSGIKNQA